MTWEKLADKLPDIGPSPEARLQGWRYWTEVIKPQMRHEQPYGPVEPPEAKVERLRQTFWNDLPIIIGPGLAKKFPGWTEKLKAQEPGRFKDIAASIDAIREQGPREELLR